MAFLNYDNDGWQDLVVLTGRRRQASPPDAVIRLYRNNRAGTFADVTAKSGLGRSAWALGIAGAGIVRTDRFQPEAPAK